VLVWKVADEIQVVDLATDPTQRRRGVARTLLRHLATLQRDGFTSIQLEVRAGNHAARALYESVGFVEQRSRNRYYTDGEDAVEMSWQLVDPAALI
jgi:ribosomal protein S18 acetylase RimI-like enzyme